LVSEAYPSITNWLFESNWMVPLNKFQTIFSLQVPVHSTEFIFIEVLFLKKGHVNLNN
jgi:hypothetical protein